MTDVNALAKILDDLSATVCQWHTKEQELRALATSDVVFAEHDGAVRALEHVEDELRKALHAYRSTEGA